MSAAPALVALTRPQQLQATWHDALERAGCICTSYPLTRLEPLAQPPNLAAQVAAADVVVVVSPAAARMAGAALLGARQVAVPGPGTEQALRSQNYSGKVISSSHNALFFDAKSLLLELTKQAVTGTALVLRGAPPASDPLMDGLAELGLSATALGLYSTPRIVLGAAAAAERRSQLQGLLRQRPVWLMAQSAAVSYLQEEALAIGEAGLQGQRCVTIHPRIAQTATLAGFSSVILSGPALDQLVSAVKSARD